RHHRFESQPQDLSQSPGRQDPDGTQPGLGRRYHLHSDPQRVCLPGGYPGSLLAQSHWLGDLQTHRCRAVCVGAENRSRRAPAPTRMHSPLRSRRAVCLPRIYTLLEQAQMRISMSRTANPYDNAHMESFFKTLKYEEVHLANYESYEDVVQRIPHFIEQVYNRKRLHSALGYLPPEEFEMATQSTTNTAGRPSLNSR